MKLSLDHLRLLLQAAEKSFAAGTVPGENDFIDVDWTNRKIMILSPVKPTMKKDGTRLMLSDGPAYHQDYRFQIHDQKGESSVTIRGILDYPEKVS